MLESGSTATNPQVNHQIPINITKHKSSLTGPHQKQGTPKKTFPTPKEPIRKSSPFSINPYHNYQEPSLNKVFYT